MNKEIEIEITRLVQITQGTRIAQGLIVPIIKAKWKEVPLSTRGQSRGGFGSTGQL